MKLFVGTHLIETDHIKCVERIAAHSVKIYFVSGYELTVACGVKSMSGAHWSQDADKFMSVLAKTGLPRLKDT